MSAAFSFPDLDVTLPRPKTLPLRAPEPPQSEPGVVGMSDARTEGRAQACAFIRAAMQQERATFVDVAEALDVNERGASRSIQSPKGKLFHIGDLITMARHGRGSARLARRIWAYVGAELDRIELAHGGR